jgi:TetR/AcrR family transcriptional regulator
MSFEREFEHRQQLFDAALAEFVERGYERASINTILQAAGMSKGQFYYHFKNKEGLYLALIGVLIQKKQAFMATVMTPADFQQDIFSVLQVQIRYGMAFAREYPAINRFAESFIQERGNAIYDKALAVYNFDDNSAIDQLVGAAFARGDFRDDLPQDFVRGVIGYMFTHAVEVAGLDTGDTFEERMSYLIAFLRDGLAGDR